MINTILAFIIGLEAAALLFTVADIKQRQKAADQMITKSIEIATDILESISDELAAQQQRWQDALGRAEEVADRMQRR